MAGDSMILSPKRPPIKELKVQNMNKSPSEYFQPGAEASKRTKSWNFYSLALLFAIAFVVRSLFCLKIVFIML